MELTIIYVTARHKPCKRWFYESLIRQIKPDDKITVRIIDTFAESDAWCAKDDGVNFLPYEDNLIVQINRPKPSVWKGEYRFTKENWWSKSNDLNTGICLCRTEWISFIDDRSVLMPRWLDAIQRAMDGPYAVCGRYQKRANVKVENGIITDMGTELGLDHRQDLPFPQPTDNWMGGHGALPLEWCLAVNGFSENYCDSLGSEDSMFGLTLYNAGFPMKYDSKMLIVEDRTVGQIDGALKRADKGVSPNDKSHAIVSKFAGARTSMNTYDIRSLREHVLAGGEWPVPIGEFRDWYDGQLVSEME